MAIRHGFVVLIAGLAVGGQAAGQTADDLINKHIEARGGYAAIKAVKTRTVAIEGILQGSPLTIVQYNKRPYLFRNEQKLGEQTMTRAVNEKTAWVSQGPGMVMQRPGFAAEHMRESVGDIDDILVDHKTKGHTVTLEGVDQVGGRKAHKLKVTLKSGAVQTLYLDQETYLLIKRERTVLTPGGDLPVTIEYGDFRRVNGLMLPHSAKQTQANLAISLTQSFAFNTQLDDAIFEMPKGATGRRRGIAGKIKVEGDRTRLWAGGDPDGPDAEWFDYTDPLIPWKKLGAGIGKDRIRSIDDPLFVSPGDPRLLSMIPASPYRRKERPKTNDDIKVIAYIEAGEARAYPIALLDQHELVNDVIGGKPVTVGW